MDLYDGWVEKDKFTGEHVLLKLKEAGNYIFKYINIKFFLMLGILKNIFS